MKNFLTVYIIVLTIAVLVGLIYLYDTSAGKVEGIKERWNGSEVTSTDNLPEEMVESYAKPYSEMLLTTHNHLFGFSLIAFTIGMIFYFNTSITGFWKSFLMIEPLISSVLTFGSLWLMRFVNPLFLYAAILSALLFYLSYFIIAASCLYELNLKKIDN